MIQRALRRLALRAVGGASRLRNTEGFGPCYLYAATVRRWVDGDTVDLTVKLGFYVSLDARFRLATVNTPERGSVNWAEATAFAAKMAPVGERVIVHSVLPTDKYGRFLARIYLPGGDGATLNDLLVAEGLAEVYETKRTAKKKGKEGAK